MPSVLCNPRLHSRVAAWERTVRKSRTPMPAAPVTLRLLLHPPGLQRPNRVVRGSKRLFQMRPRWATQQMSGHTGGTCPLGGRGARPEEGAGTRIIRWRRECLLSCRVLVRDGVLFDQVARNRSLVFSAPHGLGFRRGLPPLRPLMRDCSRPASEVGPVLNPPWNLHLPLVNKAVSLQALPALVFAPQVKPCSSPGKGGT